MHPVRLLGVVMTGLVMAGCDSAPSGDGQAAMSADSALAAVRVFHDHLAGGRVDAAMAMVQMKRPGAWEADVRRFYAGMSISMVRRRQDFAILQARTRGECAAVIVDQNLQFGQPAFDPTPMYLVRRGGVWQVLAHCNQYRELMHDLSPQELADFDLLDVWVQARVAELVRARAATTQPAG
ncbi:MAG: hypothetical protein BIFFINMI_00004 [Phycisphaerae bacterium]|nr:hypothetical protein [Phycisphaerae bacterium]